MNDPNDYFINFLAISVGIIICILIASGIERFLIKIKQHKVYVEVLQPRTMVELDDYKFVTYSAIRRVQVKP